MRVARSGQSVATTEHAMLVPYGRFAARVGVFGALRSVSFGMKTVVRSPVDKVLELLAHISSGGMHVNELSSDVHPLVSDTSVACAWGQESSASSSGVSALLHAISPEARRLSHRCRVR
jgi:hypothetical protein